MDMHVDTQVSRPEAPLMIAAKMGHLDMTRCLLINDAKDSKKEACGEAHHLGHKQIVKLIDMQIKANLRRWSTDSQYFLRPQVGLGLGLGLGLEKGQLAPMVHR